MQIGGRRLFRAKILNYEKRKELLLVAKKLKGLKEYEKVYIQNDLTYRQTQELYEQRVGEVQVLVEVSCRVAAGQG